MERISISSYILLLSNLLNKNITHNQFINSNKYKNIIKEFKIYLIGIFKKILKNKILIFKIIKLVKRLLLIFDSIFEKIIEFKESTIIVSIIFIIMKEMLKINTETLFKSKNIDLYELNDLLNLLYYNLKNQREN